MGRFIKCSSPRCDRLFPFLSGKKFCSNKCRNYADRARGVALSLRYLSTLAHSDPAYNIIYDDVGPWNQVRPSLAITIRCPENATGYRLGIGREHSTIEKPSRIRWFPSLFDNSLGVYSMDPYESPSVPFPGSYVVAYFDKEKNLCHQPDRLVRIEEASNSMMPWYRGDLSLSIKRTSMRDVLNFNPQRDR